MPELKIKCQHPESLKKIIESMIYDRVKSLKEGIDKTKKRKRTRLNSSNT
ncbi:MAG: hypothetical protein F6K17_29990 [Okeania sp. SIO3C4]|nr:hypothetical protein [Okeania sp. SIO3C4]